MRQLDELQMASMKVQFRRMYADLGFSESLEVFNEILITASLLAEIISKEVKNEKTF